MSRVPLDDIPSLRHVNHSTHQQGYTAIGLMGRGGQTELGRQTALWQGLCLCLVRAYHMGLPVRGKSQPYNKQLQCSHRRLSYSITKPPHCLKSVPESEHTVISPPKWSLSNLRTPHASSFKYKYSKKSQIIELAKQSRVKHGHEQCFL